MHQCIHLRRVFMEKWYPRDSDVFFHSRWQPLGIPFALTPTGQLHQSPQSPVPGDRACGKRRGFSPAAAARHSQSARVDTDFPKPHLFFSLLFPLFFSSSSALVQSELRAVVAAGQGGRCRNSSRGRMQQTWGKFCTKQKSDWADSIQRNEQKKDPLGWAGPIRILEQ